MILGAFLLLPVLFIGCGPSQSAGTPLPQRVVAASVQPSAVGRGAELRLAGVLKPRGPLGSGIGLRSYAARLPLPPGLVTAFRAGDPAAATLKGAQPGSSSRRLPARILAVEPDTLVVGLRFEARILDFMLLEFFVRPRTGGPDSRLRFVRVPLAAIVNPTGGEGSVFRIEELAAANESAADADAATNSDTAPASGTTRYRAVATPIVVIDRAPREGLVTVLAEIDPEARVIYQGHAQLLSGEEVRL